MVSQRGNSSLQDPFPASDVPNSRHFHTVRADGILSQGWKPTLWSSTDLDALPAMAAAIRFDAWLRDEAKRTGDGQIPDA